MANIDNLLGDISWKADDISISKDFGDRIEQEKTEYWVVEAYPFEVKKVVSKRNTNNFLKIMYYIDYIGEEFKEYFESQQMPDDAPIYKAKTVAEMQSNLLMYKNFQKIANEMNPKLFTKRQIGAAKGWATRYKNKVKKFQKEYPEKCL